MCGLLNFNKKNNEKNESIKTVINFFKQIFTWLHKQKVGTFIYTLFVGKFVWKDQFGNKYYKNSKGKKWVIYYDNIEASKIPPEWHLWIHSGTVKIPQSTEKNFSWQKKYEENLTGTERSYKPEGSLANNQKKNMKKYETWKT